MSCSDNVGEIPNVKCEQIGRIKTVAIVVGDDNPNMADVIYMVERLNGHKLDVIVIDELDESHNRLKVHLNELKGRWKIDADKEKKKGIQRSWKPQRQINHYS